MFSSARMGCQSSKTVETSGHIRENFRNGYNEENGHSQKEYPMNLPTKKSKLPPNQADKKTKQLSDSEMRKKINRYMEIEQEIREWEAKNLPKALDAKKSEASEVAQTLQDLEQRYKAACERVMKEKLDVDKMQNPSIKTFFKNQEEFAEKFSKEQEEYLEAVSEQEALKKQLDDVRKQAQMFEQDVQSMSKETNKLIVLYDEQDQILDDMFSGKYGSELENRLETEVDELLDKKERIGIAKQKWVNGRLLLQHAYDQLGHAVKRWQTLNQVPNGNSKIKYQLATETRNNLVAASQNIMSAKRYLNNIKFPYCEPEEIATLDKACSNVYTDMQSPDRHQHALQCYSVTHRRTAALLQWFDNVINHTIEKDLVKAKADLIPKEKELRTERLRLMNEKIGDAKISDKERYVLDEFDDDILEPELVAISQPDKVEVESGGLLSVDEGKLSAPTPLPLSELAPPPSQEDLFGNIEELKKQHEQERAQIERVHETNKARMEQGLQEKLRQRRSWRKRVIEE